MQVMEGVRVICCLAVFMVLCSSPCFCFDMAVFSTKTAYDWVVNSSVTEEDGDTRINYEGTECTAVHINAVLRHGSRFPSLNKMEAMAELRSRILSHNSSGPLSAELKTWVDNYPRDKQEEIVSMGRSEQFGVGRRLAQSLKGLLRDNLLKVELISSSRSRNIESAKEFFAGMKQAVQNTIFNITPEINNTLTRYYDGCDRYTNELQGNRTVLKELYDFRESPGFQSVQHNIATRLGVSNETLTTADVNLLYEMCANDLIIFNRSVLCDLMTEDERKIIEYQYELLSYYEYGYGSSVRPLIACVMMENMFRGMDDAAERHRNSQSYTVGSFKFGHIGSVLPTYTAFGLFKDSEPLLASNMAAMADRKFRTSLTTPMSANLVFVLYDCRGVGNVPSERKYAIRAFVNEIEVIMPACGAAICWYDDVRRHYFEQISNCNKNKVCAVPDPTSGSQRLPFSVFGLFILFLLVKM